MLGRYPIESMRLVRDDPADSAPTKLTTIRPTSSFVPWRDTSSGVTSNNHNLNKHTPAPFALHAAAPAAPAAASATPGGDENDDEASEGDESDEAPPAAPGTPPNWQAMGMAEPPTPPSKHATQVDLTGVPNRVMNSVFKLKVGGLGLVGVDWCGATAQSTPIVQQPNRSVRAHPTTAGDQLPAPLPPALGAAAHLHELLDRMGLRC